MGKKNSHCSYCGQPFADDVPWPRRCACGRTTWINPIPVAVVLLPVDDGLLLIRRAIEPQRGKLALPGGYVNFGESWQAGAARELVEETGIVIDPARVELAGAHSTPDGAMVLMFARAPRTTAAALPAFVATDETAERVIASAPLELAFSLHTEMARRFFAAVKS